MVDPHPLAEQAGSVDRSLRERMDVAPRHDFAIPDDPKQKLVSRSSMREKVYRWLTPFRLRSKRATKLRLVKLGGSLLDLEDLADRLQDWLAQQPGFASVLVVGGGCAADAVRERNGRGELNDTEAHWLAIEAMERNARRLATMFPEARWLERMEQVQGFAEPLGILNPVSFMRHDDPRHPQGALPIGWHVTSDSIAARVADMAHASELVLLKSAAPPERCCRQQLAAAGYVDEFFPEASRAILRVRFVNLREKSSAKAPVFI